MGACWRLEGGKCLALEQRSVENREVLSDRVGGFVIDRDIALLDAPRVPPVLNVI